MANSLPFLSAQSLLRYAFLAMPVAFAGLPLYIHAPDFYVRNQGVSLAVLGLLLLALRLIDAVMDPLIGWYFDRFHAYRKQLFFLSIAILAVGFTGLFNPPASAGLGWFATFTFLATWGYSVLSININTLGGLWQPQEIQQTRLAVYRETFTLIGVLSAAMAPTLLMAAFPAKEAFSLVSFGFLGLLAIAAIFFYRWWVSSFDPVSAARTQSFTSLQTPWRALRSVSVFSSFYGVYLLSSLASAIPAVLVLFFIEERLGAGEYAGLFLLVFFLSGALSMPFWRWLAGKTTQIVAWQIAMLIAIVSFIWAAMLGTGDLVAYALICFGSGMALGGEMCLPPSILSGLIHRHRQQRHATTWFACMAFLAKLGMALAAGITFPILGWSGFSAGTENTSSALYTLSITYGVIPCVIKLSALILLWQKKNQFHYSISEGDLHDPTPLEDTHSRTTVVDSFRVHNTQ